MAAEEGSQRHLVDEFLKARRPVYAKNHPVVMRLRARLQRAWERGLFKGNTRRETLQPTEIVEQQARIARDIYGLVYADSASGSYWVHRSKAPHRIRPGRTPQWLQNLLKDDPGRSISKLDMLLIGEAFGLPLQSWELTEDREDVFDRHIELASAGLNLLALGFDFFFENSMGGRLEISQQTERHVAPIRGSLATKRLGEIVRGVPLRVHVPFPEGFGRSQVFLFEKDAEGAVTCLSPSWLVDDIPWFDPPVAQIPRHQEELTLDVEGESVILAVLVRAEYVLFPRLADAKTNKLSRITECEMDNLKFNLLALDLDDWCIKHENFFVVAR